MATSLRSELGPLHLSWRRELQRLDRAAALRMLRAAVAHGQSMKAMRNLLSEDPGGAGLQRLNDDAVLEQLAVRIETGQIVAFSERATGGIWAERVEVAAPPDATPVALTETETTWIEFELVGTDNRPIPGQRYEATLPDGTVKQGRLDGQGLVRLHNIEEPGMVAFSFPDLDQDAWEDA